MCIISDTHLLQMALGFMQFLSFLYIFGVGFGVARFESCKLKLYNSLVLLIILCIFAASNRNTKKYGI